MDFQNSFFEQKKLIEIGHITVQLKLLIVITNDLSVIVVKLTQFDNVPNNYQYNSLYVYCFHLVNVISDNIRLDCVFNLSFYTLNSAQHFRCFTQSKIFKFCF